MKKILFWILVLFCVGALIGLSIYAKDNIHKITDPDTGETKYVFGKKPTHDSDKMLLEDGEFMIALNKSYAEGYLSNNAITSRSEVEKFYKDLKTKFKEKGEAIGSSLEFYISAKSDLDMQMYIIGDYYFEGDSINTVKFSWYDGKMIFNNVHKNISFGITERAYKGTSIRCSDDSFIYVRNDDGAVSGYVDVTKLDVPASSVYKLCNSIYTDLFYSLKVEKDTETEKKIVKVNTNIVSQMLEGTYEYDTDAFPSENLIKKEWERCYNADLYEDEGAQDVMKALMFEYAFKNKTTLKEIKFYVLLDALEEYGGIYVYQNDEYECIYYEYQPTDFVYSGILEYDMTNYTWLSDYVEMDRVNTYFVKYMKTDSKGVKQFTDSTKLLLIGNDDLAAQFIPFTI